MYSFLATYNEDMDLDNHDQMDVGQEYFMKEIEGACACLVVHRLNANSWVATTMYASIAFTQR
jgi:hypothetical protein